MGKRRDIQQGCSRQLAQRFQAVGADARLEFQYVSERQLGFTGGSAFELMVDLMDG